MKKFFNWNLWRDGFTIALAILAFIETIMAVANIQLEQIVPISSWYVRFFVILGILFVIWFVTTLIKHLCTKKAISLTIRNIPITIKEGDLFKQEDWKLIPCNEYFDTTVDDIIIAHRSLHGMFIDNYVKDLENLKHTISSAKKDIIKGLQEEPLSRGRVKFPLGRIIPYQDYMLLALTRFDDENRAYLTQNDYEACLRTMWQEISRVYAKRPISIPLMGAGITRFDGVGEKSEERLLRCILCTLKTSNAQIYEPIQIILDKKTLNKIDLYNFNKFQ